MTTALLAVIGAVLGVMGGLVLYGPDRLSVRIAQSSFASSDTGGVALSSPVRLGDRPGLTLLSAIVSTTTVGQPGRPALLLARPVFNLDPGHRNAGARPDPAPPAADLGAALAPALGTFVAHGFKTLAIRNGEIRIATAATGDGEPIVLTDLTAEIDGTTAGQFSARGGFTMRGQRFEFNGRLDAPKDARRPDERPLRFTLKSPVLDAAFDGRLDTTAAMRIAGLADGSMLRATRTLRWLGIDSADSDLLAGIAFKGQLDWAGPALTLKNARLTVDGNEATGGLTLGWSGTRPSFDGTLAFGSLAIERYLGVAGEDDPVAALGAAPWRAHDSKLPFISIADADLRVSAADVRLAGVSLGRAAATLTARDGVLTVDVAELQSASGIAQFNLRVDQTGPAPRYGLRAKCEQDGGSILLDRLFGRAILGGRVLTTMDLTGAGATLADILADLSGPIAMSMRPGGQLHADLAALARMGVAPDPGWARVAATGTPIEALELRGRLATGSMLLDRLDILSRRLRLGGRGRLALAARTLDLEFEAADARSEVTAAADDSQRAPPKTRISLSGPWHQPRIRSEPTNPSP